MSNIMATVDKHLVAEQIGKMNACLTTANAISGESNYITIDAAKQSLYRAKGIYDTLHNLNLLYDWRTVSENISRVEEKICYILEEKRRQQLREFRVSKRRQ